MPVLFQCRIQHRDLKANRHCWYVFGDNLVKSGYGGQAFAMRGEPNSVGIPTKRLPDTTHDSYFYDDEFEEFADAIQPSLVYIANLLKASQTVIMPLDGVGSGRANLHTQPKLWKYLQEELNCLGLLSPKGMYHATQ